MALNRLIQITLKNVKSWLQSAVPNGNAKFLIVCWEAKSCLKVPRLLQEELVTGLAKVWAVHGFKVLKDIHEFQLRKLSSKKIMFCFALRDFVSKHKLWLVILPCRSFLSIWKVVTRITMLSGLEYMQKIKILAKCRQQELAVWC